MVVRQVYNIDNTGQLLISLPDNFKRRKQVLVVLDDSLDKRSDKMKLMRKASKDVLFQQDIDSITQDFANSDFENL